MGWLVWRDEWLVSLLGWVEIIEAIRSTAIDQNLRSYLADAVLLYADNRGEV
jgi:hypothetical protein